MSAVDRTIVMVLEYDGTNFCGWQVQPGLRSIQGELEKIIPIILRSPISPVRASGRTDSGVHARAQVVSCKVGGERTLDRNMLLVLAKGLSHYLAGEVSVRALWITSDDFDPRRHAVGKQYRYQLQIGATPPALERGQVWWRRPPFNLSAVHEQLPALLGTHDFCSFQGAGAQVATTVRTIQRAEFNELSPGRYELVLEGDGFLKQMVRTITGTLVQIGEGACTSCLSSIIAAKNRSAAGITAPACGLALWWVQYPEFRSDTPEQLALLSNQPGSRVYEYTDCRSIN